MISRADLEAALEAVLFAAAQPVPVDRLAGLFEGVSAEDLDAALTALRARYQPEPGRGLFIEEVAGGLRIVTAAEYHPYLKKFFDAAGGNKLSMAAIETLAIVAYRQPVTAPEVQEMRGKQSQAVIRNLLEKRLLRISGRKEVVGRPFLYSTTREFLMHFGLKGLGELPPLEEFEETFGSEPVEAIEVPDSTAATETMEAHEPAESDSAAAFEVESLSPEES
ncbi:MAG: SMC-Scp complex subunit ScpB [Thermoanaerobaculia bacterium]|jgi:segregation and condensation protein B|nr:SMC-Scp complex subunit ScpB [Thermoanaerobaculia bacterium]MBP9824494.1 SMC-Scp complex subunit ScpB [Thermoanaerobaculia bacterium]